jgi:hypothetical protein
VLERLGSGTAVVASADGQTGTQKRGHFKNRDVRLPRSMPGGVDGLGF